MTDPVPDALATPSEVPPAAHPPEETTMSTHYRWYCAAAAAIFLAASPANAVQAAGPTHEAGRPQSCPRVDALAKTLRAGGFSSPAAQNYAILTRRDCLNQT
jgi:hypothetical protein